MINFKTQDPTDKKEGYVLGQFGSYNTYTNGLVYNLPLDNGWKLRLVGHSNVSDGYKDNIASGIDYASANRDETSFRAKLLKDEQGKLKYICTDAARQIFQFKDEDGSIQKDVRATKLTKALLDGELKSTTHKIACDKMKDGSSEEFNMYTDNYYDIKDLFDGDAKTLLLAYKIQFDISFVSELMQRMEQKTFILKHDLLDIMAVSKMTNQLDSLLIMPKKVMFRQK